MSEIPADVKALAVAALKEAGHGDINNVDLVLDEAIEIISGAILAERERCQEWKPIDTAPKDGSKILAFAQGSYHRDHYYGVAQWAFADPDFPSTVDGWFWEYAIRPTHWQPLPQPPGAGQ